MSENKTAQQQERQALRRQLRAAGWNVGAGETSSGEGGRKRMLLALWPAPHTGPTPGIEPRWVAGADKTDALRNAVRELSGKSGPEEAALSE